MILPSDAVLRLAFEWKILEEIPGRKSQTFMNFVTEKEKANMEDSEAQLVLEVTSSDVT